MSQVLAGFGGMGTKGRPLEGGGTEARHRVSLALRLRPGVGEAWRWQGGPLSSSPWTPVSTLGSSVLFSKGQVLPQQLFWRWPPYRGQLCALPPVSPAGLRRSQQRSCQISCLYRGVWCEPGSPHPPAQGHPRGCHGTSLVRGPSRAVGKPQLYPPPLPELGPQAPTHGAWWAGPTGGETKARRGRRLRGATAGG